jgi:hypothetical protein
MSREIITTRDLQKLYQSDEAGKIASDTEYVATADSYFDRLFKYIPSEIVAGYIFIQAVLKQLSDSDKLLVINWLIFAVFCVLTPLYLWRIQKVLKIQQHIITLTSFIVWAFALGGPFSLYTWYDPVYGAILLPVYTIVAAIIEAE